MYKHDKHQDIVLLTSGDTTLHKNIRYFVTTQLKAATIKLMIQYLQPTETQ